MQTTLDSNASDMGACAPNLKQRSNEEIMFAALVLQSLGQLTLEALARSLRDGDLLGQVDAVHTSSARCIF